jgi:NAD+ kinase
MSPLSVGVYVHWRKTGAIDSLKALLSALDAVGMRALVEEHAARCISVKGYPLETVAAESDLIIVLGGDGTILRLIRDLRGDVRPIMGINFGTLGFLTAFSGPGFHEALKAVQEGNYRVDERTLLEVSVIREDEVVLRQLGLNDVVLTRGERSRLVQVEVQIDGELLSEYNADGLIVATSTGSTAYSLSAGGPIVMPRSGVLVVTPICPHALTNRSVVVSNRSLITVRASRGEFPLMLSVDGQDSGQVMPSDLVKVAAGDRRVPLLFPRHFTFADILRSKLRWSGSNI